MLASWVYPRTPCAGEPHVPRLGGRRNLAGPATLIYAGSVGSVEDCFHCLVLCFVLPGFAGTANRLCPRTHQLVKTCPGRTNANAPLRHPARSYTSRAHIFFYIATVAPLCRTATPLVVRLVRTHTQARQQRQRQGSDGGNAAAKEGMDDLHWLRGFGLTSQTVWPRRAKKSPQHRAGCPP